MDENDALVGFDLKGNGVIDKHHLGNGREVVEKITCMRIRVHGRIGCPSFPEKKSGQVLVRTLKGQRPKPDAAGTPVPHDNFPLAVAGGCERHRRAIEKADRFWFAPWEAKTQARCGRDAVPARQFPAGSRGGCERHRRAIEKADRFWFAPWEAKTQARCGRRVSSASDFRRQVQRLWPEDTATIQKEMASPASSFT